MVNNNLLHQPRMNMEPIVELLRTPLPTETLGSILVNGICEAKTMELPYLYQGKPNVHNHCCYPDGRYRVRKELFTEKHPYPHFRVLGVKDRDGILWHKITYVQNLKGCTGIGGAFKDLNKDGVPDIVDSTKALQHLVDILPNEFWLDVRKK